MIRPIKVKYRTRRKHARTKDWHHKDNLRYHPEFHIRKKALLDYWFLDNLVFIRALKEWRAQII